MTRKDYVLLSAAIVATQERIKSNRFDKVGGKTYPADQNEQLRGVRRAAAAICDALAADNPRFDPAQFLTACGYGAITMNPRDPALDLRPLPEDDPTQLLLKAERLLKERGKSMSATHARLALSYMGARG